MAKALTKRFGTAKQAKAALKGGTGSGLLRRLKADETVKVRFLQDLEDWEEGWYHWLGGNFQWCSRMNSCEGCKSGDRARKIVLANAVVIASDNDKEQGKVVVMQMAPTLAMSLVKFHEKRGTLLDRDYDLTREGSGLNDTVYSADPDDPKKRNLARFATELHDIPALISAEMGSTEDDDEDEEEEPRSTKKPGPKKSSSRRRDEEDDYEDDEEEDEQDDFSSLNRSELKLEIKKLDRDFVAKKSQSDDDLRAYLWDLNYAEDTSDGDDDGEEDEEDERSVHRSRSSRPAVKTKSRRGMDEFKPKTTSNPVRRVKRSR